MNKIFIALGLTLATATGAFAQSSAVDAYAPRAFDAAEVTAAAPATTPDLVVYDRPGNDGSPTFSAPPRPRSAACRKTRSFTTAASWMARRASSKPVPGAGVPQPAP